MKNQKVKTYVFASAVSRVVRGIRRGRVMTYGTVAARAGFPGAARAVGTLMRKNFDPRVPCHRVICADGRVGHYNRGEARKVALLREEGVAILGRKVQK